MVETEALSPRPSTLQARGIILQWRFPTTWRSFESVSGPARPCVKALASRPPVQSGGHAARADPALRTFQSGTGDFWVAAPNCSASVALISRWRSRKARSSSRLRRSQPVTSSLHLLALQEPQAGATLSSV